MLQKALEPRELIVEARPRLWIAVGQVDRGDDEPFDLGFEITGLLVGGLTGQSAPNLLRRLAFGQDRHAVMRALTMPDGAIARILDFARRKFRIVGLDFLQADDVGRGLVQPLDQAWQPSI